MQTASPSEFEAEARRHLDPAVYDFYAGGADGEVTLRANEAVLQTLRADLDRALALCGCRSPRDLTREFVRLPGPAPC
jgi:4-hydroxymandelate oxidase